MELKDLSLDILPIDDIPELKALTNDRQRNFAVFYVANGGNGADAARKAGYSEKTANRTGGQIAKTPSVKAAVRAVREWFFANLILSKNEALAILSQMARGSIADVMDADGSINKNTIRKAGRIIESYDEESGKVKLRDPRAAIETIGKVLGWFRDDIKIHAGNVEIRMEHL